MSTVAEIEKAIGTLSAEERRELEDRIFARHCLDSWDREEMAQLRASLDAAEAEIEGGQGLTAYQMREAVRSWFRE